MQGTQHRVIEVPHKDGGNDVFPRDTHMFITHSARFHWLCSSCERDWTMNKADTVSTCTELIFWWGRHSKESSDE